MCAFRQTKVKFYGPCDAHNVAYTLKNPAKMDKMCILEKCSGSRTLTSDRR